MQVRRTIRLALMLLASRSRSPRQWVRVVLSLPAKSTRDNCEIVMRDLSWEEGEEGEGGSTTGI